MHRSGQFWSRLFAAVVVALVIAATSLSLLARALEAGVAKAAISSSLPISSSGLLAGSSAPTIRTMGR
jgi:hypothetical protein